MGGYFLLRTIMVSRIMYNIITMYSIIPPPS